MRVKVTSWGLGLLILLALLGLGDFLLVTLLAGLGDIFVEDVTFLGTLVEGVPGVGAS